MLRLTLTDEQRKEVETLRRDASMTPAERNRVDMVLLSASGWPVPQIAMHHGVCRATVRRLIKAYTAQGAGALRRQPPGPGKDLARREQVTAALGRLLEQERTWTAAQLAEALGEERITLSPRQTRKYLAVMGARWRRTVRSLTHKQNPARVAAAATTLATLKKRVPLAPSNSRSSMRAASAPASQ